MKASLTVLVVSGAMFASAAVAQAGTIYGIQRDPTSGAYGRLGAIDSQTGVGVDIGAFGSTASGQPFEVFALAVSAGGGLYGSLRDYTTPHLTLINASNASPTVGAATSAYIDQMDFHPNGTLYGISGSTFLTLDTVTGVSTVLGTTSANFYDIAFDSAGVLWGCTGDALYTVNLSNGATTFKGFLSTAGQRAISGIAFDSHNVLYGVSNNLNSSLYTIDTSTYAATLINSTGLTQVWDIDFAPEVVPLPRSAWSGIILLAGLGGFAAVRRLRLST